MFHTRTVKALAALSALCCAVPVFAQSVIVDRSGAVQAVIGAYTGMVQGSTITRPANATTYSASQSICGATNITVCAPGTISITNLNSGRLAAKRVTLLKSSSTTANASFTIWFFSASPGMTVPNQFDGTSYTGPRSADMPNYLGNATCAGGTATSDTTPLVWYECALPTTSLVLQAAAGVKTIFYMLSANAAYVPATSETFTPYMGGQY